MPCYKISTVRTSLYGVIFLKKIFIKHAKYSCLYLQPGNRNILVHSFLFVPGQVKVIRTHSKQNCEVFFELQDLIPLSFLLFGFPAKLNILYSNFFSSCRNRILMCTFLCVRHLHLIEGAPFMTKY